jgi:hypothetical protein
MDKRAAASIVRCNIALGNQPERLYRVRLTLRRFQEDTAR